MDKQVFISYNRKDKKKVRTIYDVLNLAFSKGGAWHAWLDAEELPPGQPWKNLASEALKQSNAVVVFFGPHGDGDWQKVEVDLAQDLQVSDKIPVIPLLLPGAPKDPELPGFLQRNTWIDFRDGLDNKIALRNLIWGITGKKPGKDLFEDAEPATKARVESEPRRDREDSAVRDTVEDLAGELEDTNVTFFIGGKVYAGGDDLPPGPQEIAGTLFSEIGLLPDTYKDLSLLSVNLAGTYYQIQEREKGLDRRVKKLIEEGSKTIPSTYLCLARLLKQLKDRRKDWGEAQSLQLIVTTNFDLLMECVLLLEGVPFTRIVQHRSGQSIQIDEFTRLPREKTIEEVEGNLSDWLNDHGETETFDRPSDLVSLSLDQYCEPILYKFYGSIDVRRSCLISSEQYLQFINSRGKQEFIPDRIRDIIMNTPALFLGYELLDPAFQLIYHMFQETFKNTDYDNYALMGKPENEQASLWDRMVRAARDWRITVLEGDDKQLGFIEKLIDQIKV